MARLRAPGPGARLGLGRLAAERGVPGRRHQQRRVRPRLLHRRRPPDARARWRGGSPCSTTHHASLLAGTFPNRQYLHSAQSNGRKVDPGPLDVGIFTRHDDLGPAGEGPASRARYYYTDIPVLLLWGDQYEDVVASTDRYFERLRARQAAAGVGASTRASPAPLRTDDHPQGDVRIGQRFVREVFGAFQRSTHWEHGRVHPRLRRVGRVLRPRPAAAARRRPREPASLDDSFGQSGFRVPDGAGLAVSPAGGVDHRVYDHTSILRFLEWRFLGAPAEGPKAASGRWWLTRARPAREQPRGVAALVGPGARMGVRRAGRRVLPALQRARSRRERAGHDGGDPGPVRARRSRSPTRSRTGTRRRR